MHRRTFCQFAFLPLLLPLVGCGRREDDYEPAFSSRPRGAGSFSFAVHPLHNPALLHAIYGPLIDYLNVMIPGSRFRLVASRDYAAFQDRLDSRDFHFALPNPYQAVCAAGRGYRIFAKMAGDEDFRGLILTRRDSPVEAIADLRGRRIAYPAPTAVAATMLPQHFLHQNGVPLASTRTRYVGSMESALESLVLGSSDAAAVWPDPWSKYVRAKPERARQLAVRWRTPHLVNNPLVVRDDVPAGLAADLLRALTGLGRSAPGRQLLARMSVAGFEAADDRTYDPVRLFLRDFSRTIRPLDLPPALA